MMQKFNLNFVFCLKEEKEDHYNPEIAGCWINICVVGLCCAVIRSDII